MKINKQFKRRRIKNNNNSVFCKICNINHAKYYLYKLIIPKIITRFNNLNSGGPSYVYAPWIPFYQTPILDSLPPYTKGYSFFLYLCNKKTCYEYVKLLEC